MLCLDFSLKAKISGLVLDAQGVGLGFNAQSNGLFLFDVVSRGLHLRFSSTVVYKFSAEDNKLLSYIALILHVDLFFIHLASYYSHLYQTYRMKCLLMC